MNRLRAINFLLIISLTACSTAISAQTPTLSISPTQTPIPTKTSTPTQTSTPTPLPNFEIGDYLISEIDGMTMMYVPAGEFTMGSNARGFYAIPERKIYLDAYWIDKTEVTNSMYKKCVESGYCHRPIKPHYVSDPDPYYDDPKYGDFPVNYVNWMNAFKYCQWVGRKLPTEAQWEKAARGTEGYIYPWGGDDDTSYIDLFFGGIIFGELMTVGAYEKGMSPYGVLDLVGGVGEWVIDKVSVAGDHSRQSDDYYKVARGYYLETMARTDRNGSGEFYEIGFRCAASQVLPQD